MLCQLEIPNEVVLAAADAASFVALNAAPARPIDLVPDLLVVNRLEHEVVSARPSSSRSPTAPRALRSSRTAARSRAPSRRR